jgi:hypothetical protein
VKTPGSEQNKKKLGLFFYSVEREMYRSVSSPRKQRRSFFRAFWLFSFEIAKRCRGVDILSSFMRSLIVCDASFFFFVARGSLTTHVFLNSTFFFSLPYYCLYDNRGKVTLSHLPRCREKNVACAHMFVCMCCMRVYLPSYIYKRLLSQIIFC